MGYRIRFQTSNWPYVTALGALPAAFGGPLAAGGVQPVRRADLLRRLIEATRDVDLLPASVQDAGFCSLLRLRIGGAIDALLYGDDGVWEDYTRPAIVRAAPLGLGLAAAAAERRRHLAGAGAGRHAAALLELPGSLEALAHRLGGHATFGAGGCEEEALAEGQDLNISALDACAYAHLSVLFSIACEPGSRLQQLLASHKTLVHLCDRLELALGAWPDPQSFLAAIESRDRLPAAAATAESKATAQGWAGGKLQRRVPSWHAMAFALAASASLAVAAALGFTPWRLEQLLTLGGRVRTTVLPGEEAE